MSIGRLANYLIYERGIPNTLTIRGPASNVTYDLPGATQEQIDLIDATIATWNWKNPNFDQFILDTSSDTSIPLNTRRDLIDIGQWYLMGKEKLALSFWNLLKDSLSGAVKTAIRNHAQNNNIKLPN